MLPAFSSRYTIALFELVVDHRDIANRRRRFLLLSRFLLDIRCCLCFSARTAHTKKLSRWKATSCRRRFRAIPDCAVISSRPTSSRSKFPLILAIISRSRLSRLRVSTMSLLPSRKAVRLTIIMLTIISTVSPSKLLCIDDDVISGEYLCMLRALSSHRRRTFSSLGFSEENPTIPAKLLNIGGYFNA